MYSTKPFKNTWQNFVWEWWDGRLWNNLNVNGASRLTWIVVSAKANRSTDVIY